MTIKWFFFYSFSQSQLKKQSSCNPGCCPPATCGSSNKKTEPSNKKTDTKKSVEPKKTAAAPPQPASAPQPPVAATLTEAGSGKKKKKKGLWARLTRKMSTLGNSSMTKGTYPSFVVPMKTFGHSTVHYKAKKTPPTKRKYNFFFFIWIRLTRNSKYRYSYVYDNSERWCDVSSQRVIEKHWNPLLRDANSHRVVPILALDDRKS